MYQIRMRSSYTHIVYNVVLLVGLESKLSYYDNRRQYIARMIPFRVTHSAFYWKAHQLEHCVCARILCTAQFAQVYSTVQCTIYSIP